MTNLPLDEVMKQIDAAAPGNKADTLEKLLPLMDKDERELIEPDLWEYLALEAPLEAAI